MRVIVLLLSVFAATMGALTIFASDWANRIARMFVDRPGFYVATWPASAPEGSESRTPSERAMKACYYCVNPSESMLPFTVVA